MTEIVAKPAVWVPRAATEELPPPLTIAERLMVDRLIRAEVRAARAEEALRWARDSIAYCSQQEIITNLLGDEEEQ